MDIRTEKTIYFPMLVPSSGRNEIMSREENQAVWKKFYAISQLAQDIITHEQMPQKIVELQEKYQLADGLVGMVSLHIRKIFFEEMSLSDAGTSLRNILVSNGDDGNKANAIVQFIQQEILTLKPKPRKEEREEETTRLKSATVRLPLLQALSKYEQLGNQLITQERIKIKSQSEPVRPSLLYWIKYYRDELGIGHHDSVQRGNFLFRSENGKRLSAEERERVNVVLKSVEENFPLEIDTERSEIIFPVFEAPVSRPIVPPLQPPMAPYVAQEKMQPRINPAFGFGHGSMTGGTSAAAPAPPQGGEMSFSSKHVFPAEKEAPAPRTLMATVSMPETPSTGAPAAVGAQTVPRPNPFRIHPVSLGKEE